MLTLHTESELDYLLQLLDPVGDGKLSYNIANPTDQSWIGRTAQGVIGESAAVADRFKPMYCKHHAGSGTMFHFYDASSNTASNVYDAVSLLHSSGSYSIGDTIEVTIGDGLLVNSSWPGSSSLVGKSFYLNPGSAYITFSVVNSTGNHIQKLGTLLSVRSSHVFQISFTYPEIVV